MVIELQVWSIVAFGSLLLAFSYAVFMNFGREYRNLLKRLYSHTVLSSLEIGEEVIVEEDLKLIYQGNRGDLRGEYVFSISTKNGSFDKITGALYDLRFNKTLRKFNKVPRMATYREISSIITSNYDTVPLISYWCSDTIKHTNLRCVCWAAKKRWDTGSSRTVADGWNIKTKLLDPNDSTFGIGIVSFSRDEVLELLSKDEM